MSIIDEHHFTPQTTEKFNKSKIIKSKSLILYDIESINYEYLENLFNDPQWIYEVRGASIFIAVNF